ncbi:glycosyltransferase family 4 protein [Pseudothermotoga thermarum]|uniref:Glycosyl transferase, family 4, conserved region n=1 Tax=Pseudothermotoga thermarum DSM 5069 TaxID=688269 RepID=F7YXQ7_9THEM|nr:MraY family glycosyltransferase [Pseudothermotoga thermarum]AEH50701.1 Glycosyl transferase, family 4, conserved region [Pseudothermotoga thermarum DSM 5069]
MKEFFVSFILSVLFTPLLSKIALKFGIVDRPDNHLKNHGKVVPYLGGVALYLSVLPFLKNLILLFILTGFMLLGLADDIKKLSWQFRLTIEFFLAALLVLRFSKDFLSFLFNVILTVAIINAVNMSDGLDGACAVVVSLGILLGNFGKIGLAFVGALLGYLVFNFPPTKVHMGDAGTYLLGAFVSYMIVGRMDNPFDLKPVLLFFLPLLDLLSAVIRRISHHKSPFKGDLDHVHHKLFRRFAGTPVVRKRKVILALGFLTVVYGVASYTRFGVLLAAVLSILLVAYLRLFFYDEKEVFK